MDSNEHAKIWHQAARIVAGMDTLQASLQHQTQIPFAGQGQYNGMINRSYSPEEVAMNRAYSAAAQVLYVIASEYEKQKDAAGT